LAVEKGRDATGIDREILDQAAMEMIGRKLTMDANEIKKCLDPRNFVDHHAVAGGAAPAEVKRMAAARQARLKDDENTVKEHRARIDGGKAKLREAVQRVMA
jgi:argininosuccinate lyase